MSEAASSTSSFSVVVAGRRPLSPPPEPQTSPQHPHPHPYHPRPHLDHPHHKLSQSQSPPPPPRSHHPGDRGSPSSHSPLMSDSPTSTNYASTFSASTQTSPAQTSLANVSSSSSASLSSPPLSSFAMSAQNSQHQNSSNSTNNNTTATPNSFPTPASSVSGQLVSAAPEEYDGGSTAKYSSVSVGGQMNQHQQDIEGGGDGETGSDPMEIDGTSAQGVQGGSAVRNTATIDHAMMELDAKPQSLTSSLESDPSIASLQSDMGQAFHVCKTSYSITGPSPHWDFVSLYGLGPVAASVARTDPVTGEKINRLRKSYEGKIKLLGLAGRNKPVKPEPGAPGGLRHLTMWPEEEWQNQKVYGKEIKVAEPDSSLYKLQMKAMKFEPGPVPNNEYWEDVLGHEKQPKLTAADPSKKPSVSSTSMFRQSGLANVTPTTSTPRATAAVAAAAAQPAAVDTGRPKRAGKKRSYTDDSFVGYGDGFPDDDLEGGVYSGGEAGSSKKKRRKDQVSSVSSSFNDRGGSYGVGMFGVGAR